MKEIDPEVIDALIAVGHRNEPIVPRCLEDRQTAWYKIRAGTPWRTVAKSLPESHLFNLIRGFVLYGQAGGWLGGSGSPVITLYREYIVRFPEKEPALTEWIVDNRTNDYEPFGTVFDEGARTYSDFIERRRKRLEWEEARWRQRREEERTQKFLREKEKATARLANAVRRGDLKAVEALLAKGADPAKAMPRGNSLVHLALEHGRHEMAEYLRSRAIK